MVLCEVEKGHAGHVADMIYVNTIEFIFAEI